MKRVVLFLQAFVLFTMVTKAQTVDIATITGTSGNALFGTSSFAANECIYAESEIGASNFTSAATPINIIGYSVFTLGATPTYNNVNIYMKNISSSTISFAADGPADPLSGYTLVYSGSVTLTGTGFFELPLTTPFVRTAGSNLQVLVTRTDGTSHGSSFNCANGSGTNTALTTTRRYNNTGTYTTSTTLARSAFRQAIRLRFQAANDASVTAVYTLGKLPVPNAEMQVIKANVTNVGANALTNIPVTVNITGANSYTATETIASLAPGASSVVTYPATFFFNSGANNVSVSIPADDILSNNEFTINQSVNANTWSYAYGATPTGGVGFTGFTGDFVAKFNTNAATFISQISVNFSAGGQPFKIGIWDASGTAGTPGTLVWESTAQTSTAGVFVMPISTPVALAAGDFYVGVRQTGTVNVSFAYQAENPIRPQTFYFASPMGSTTWTDFAPANPFRFMIEPKLILGTDASVTGITTNGGTTASCAAPTQNMTVTISNPAANDIPPGSATAYLYITGANTYSSSATNSSTIVMGGSETINFPNVPLTNPGTNRDSAFVVVFGDQDPENDTLKFNNQLVASASAHPTIEGFESNPPAYLGTVQQLSLAGLWTFQNGSFNTAGLAAPLAPHSGNRYALYDCWTIASGASARLYGTCYDVPAVSGSPCNTTELGFWMSHDASESASHDSIYVAISTNGGTTWTRIQGFDRVDLTALVPTWKKETIDLSAYAGQSIRIAFEAVSKFGNAMGLDNVMIGSRAVQSVALEGTTVGSVNLSSSCDDGGWTYYSDPLLPNANVLAINWDPGNTGANATAKAAAIPSIAVDLSHYSSESTGTQEAAYTMKRYWNVDIGSNSLTDPVNVRFFYDSSEIAAVTTAVNNFITANGGTAKTPTWFKTNTGAFVPSGTSVTPQGVPFAIALTNANTTNARINGIPYAQFDGVTSFSGGTYTSGVGLGSPLEPSFLDIEAQRSGTSNRISWALPGAYNAAHFMVERSFNGSEFYSIEKVNATNAHTTGDQSYTTYDKMPSAGVNYYRVKVVENDGKSSYSKVVNVRNDKANPISVFPNPAKDQVGITLHMEHETVATIRVTDVTGKIMVDLQQTLTEGSNKITVALNSFAKGTYVIKMITDNATYTEQFNVQ